MTARTLYDKVWQDHLVDEQPDGTCLIYVDRHLVHEVTSPQAFEGLRLAGRKVHAPDKTLLVVDHNVPTTDRTKPNPDPESAAQIAYLAENAKLFGLEYFDEFDKRQGIVHIIGPEQGFTLPGTTIVCGDSHTATPKTSSSPSSARSVPRAAPATPSNMPARRSMHSPWKAA